MKQAAFAGGLLGAAIFFFCAYIGGFGPCVDEASNDLCYEVANAPARVYAEFWTDGPVRPQAKGRDCAGTSARPWSAQKFVGAGVSGYALFGAIAMALARMGFGDR